MEKEMMNTRVLVIDDEESVRDSIEEILVPPIVRQNEKVMTASRILFDDDDDEKVVLPARSSQIPVFSVDKAANGRQGLEKINQSIIANNPYSVIFLDMRMPGWDGLETALRIREVDIKAEIIIVTAYTDRSIEEIVAKAGQNVGYHCKPYAAEEILQLATKGVNDYHKLRNLEKLILLIASINVSEPHLNSLLQNILDQLAMYIGSDTAILGKLLHNNRYQKLYSIGAVEKKVNIHKISEIIASSKFDQEEVEQIDEVVFVKLDGYSIFILVDNALHLKTEKLYLLKLFVQSAAKAIKNVQLHEELIQKEKLSAVGKALGMLMHDLRSPIKNIPILTSLIRQEGGSGELLDMIDLCGVQASEIFEDFLDFLSEAPLILQPIAIGPLIKNCVKAIRKANQENGVSIHEDIAPGLFIQGDLSKLRRVIMNLLNNAVESLQTHSVEEPTINITVKQEEGMAIIIIKDNGRGIPDKIIGNLFEAFVTADKSNGTGLGLTIVKQYITAHGGTIMAENNHGAQFTIQLPLML